MFLPQINESGHSVEFAIVALILLAPPIAVSLGQDLELFQVCQRVFHDNPPLGFLAVLALLGFGQFLVTGVHAVGHFFGQPFEYPTPLQ